MTHAKERRGWLGSCPLHRKSDNKPTKAAVRTTQKLPGRIFTQLAKIMFCDKNLQNRPQMGGVQRRPGRRSPSFCDRDPFLRSYNLAFLWRHLDWNQGWMREGAGVGLPAQGHMSGQVPLLPLLDGTWLPLFKCNQNDVFFDSSRADC